jgi:hypothetical protein
LPGPHCLLWSPYGWHLSWHPSLRGWYNVYHKTCTKFLIMRF